MSVAVGLELGFRAQGVEQTSVILERLETMLSRGGSEVSRRRELEGIGHGEIIGIRWPQSKTPAIGG